MDLYDAKDPQQCKICNFDLNHNKQGRFTTHLKEKHGMKLEEYLLKYFYKKEQLLCQFEKCENLVQLRRGIPKKHCSQSCSGKSLLLCEYCNKTFYKKHKGTKTCSEDCAFKTKKEKITKWHALMAKEKKDIHFKNIISKTSTTRRRNKTPSWNSGKTGVYSDETIEKIRNATLEQMKNQRIVKTNIEKIMDKLLDELDVQHRYSFILNKRQFDFVLPDHRILIECDGDYWHANPKFYPNPAPWQIERIKIDELKNKIASSNGYKILRFWEDDIKENIDEVIKKITSYI
ncbi:DUF559 domain-containing protein [Bacillaceae bacterium IKA-2]|jgi:very-short-patch-repair endonuclease|nr:DUF559 domain-containing protein [Bacillaceae bacterium IKA-2]